MKRRFLILSVCVAAVCYSSAKAETKWKITPSADIVSSYVWRGLYQTGASVQPALTISYADGLFLGAWGSTDFSTMAKEFDITLGYNIGGFAVSLTDYWWAGEGNSYGNYSAFHYVEGAIGYSSDRFGITWNTMIREGDDGAEGYKQNYSTYVKGDLKFGVGGVSCMLSAGISPWTGIYHQENDKPFAVSSVSLRATKEVKLGDGLSLPVFVEAICAPARDNVFLVLGISL